MHYTLAFALPTGCAKRHAVKLARLGRRDTVPSLRWFMRSRVYRPCQQVVFTDLYDDAVGRVLGIDFRPVLDQLEPLLPLRHKVSPFALTTTVIQQTRWTPEILSERQEDLLAAPRTAWNLQPTNSGATGRACSSTLGDPVGEA